MQMRAGVIFPHENISERYRAYIEAQVQQQLFREPSTNPLFVPAEAKSGGPLRVSESGRSSNPIRPLR
jgi:hypothetical protein